MESDYETATEKEIWRSPLQLDPALDIAGKRSCSQRLEANS